MRSGRSDVAREAGLLAFARCEHRHERDSPDLRYPGSARPRAPEHRGGLRHRDQRRARRGVRAPPCRCGRRSRDTADALRVLKRHYKLVILSNVHRDGFAASNRKLGVEFDAICTAEDVGSYKPADANFEYLLAHLKVGPRDGQGRHPAHPRKACTTTMSRRSASASPTPGSTGSACRREETGGRRRRSRRCRRPTSCSSRWARWPKRSRRRRVDPRRPLGPGKNIPRSQ